VHPWCSKEIVVTTVGEIMISEKDINSSPGITEEANKAIIF
jgi:hypothetical protein